MPSKYSTSRELAHKSNAGQRTQSARQFVPSTAAVTILLVLAATAVPRLCAAATAAAAVEQVQGLCAYPCILQNGCICNHTIVTQGSDGQQYGTCTSCNLGWSGYNCGNDVSPCVNGGTLRADGSCSCTYSWRGAHCGDLQCLHSYDGTGPESIVPVNATNNQCTQCEPSWGGMACELCTEDSQCAGGATCYQGTNYYGGSTKIFQCNIMSSFWNSALSNGRPGVTTQAKMQCENVNGALSCYISLWRTEENASWRDPFLYCGASNCTVNTVQGITNQTVTPVPWFATPVRYALEGVVLATVIAMELVSSWPSLPNAKRSVLLGATCISICIALGVLVGFSAAFAHETITETTINQTVTTYECAHTNCTCAKDPPLFEYQPFCSLSYVGQYIVPTLTGTTTVACDIDTNVCIFSQQQLGGITIELQCNASECSNQTQPPVVPNYTIGDETSTVLIVVAVFGGILLVVVISYLVALQRSNALKREFSAAQLVRDSPRGSPTTVPDSPINTMGGAVDSTRLLATPQAKLASFSSTEQLEVQPALHLQAVGLTYSVTGRADAVLRSASMDAMSGEIVAIIGPSGAGKTTLLDILACRDKVGSVQGSFRVNGLPITAANASQYRRIIGYVAQEDNLVPTLTVRETIYFAAKLKLPVAFSESLIHDIVEETIDVLHLRECANTRVGSSVRRGISGGEKRRVSIATELVANPRVLFMDEPTSGLDSVSAEEVMHAVVNLTKRPAPKRLAAFFNFQPAVVFSIHQPSSEICSLFDRVVLVSRGYVLYSGPTNTALESVATTLRTCMPPPAEPREGGSSAVAKTARSLAEELLKMQHDLTPQGVASLDAMIREQVDAPQHVRPLAVTTDVLANATATMKYYPRTWDQIRTLSQRTWASLLGSNYLLHSHAAATVFLSVVLSFLYNQEELNLTGTEDKAGMMTFLLLIVAFSSMSSLDLFISEKLLFSAERENGYYSTMPYFVVKVVFDFIPLRLVPTLMLASAIYFPMGLRVDSSEHFLWFLYITSVFSMFVTGLCFCVAIVTPAFGTAALVSSLLILWHTVFGGLMIQSASIPIGLRWCKYFSPFYYGYEALMVNELAGQACVFNPTDSEGSYTTWSVPIACQQFLFNLGLDPRDFNLDVGLLSVGTIANLVVGGILLWLVRVRH